MAHDATALDDPNHLDALRSYEILDTSPEPAFDRWPSLRHKSAGCSTPPSPSATAQFVSSTVVTLPDKALGFTKGFQVRDPDGHAIQIVSP